jgi:hypothetical protein
MGVLLLYRSIDGERDIMLENRNFFPIATKMVVASGGGHNDDDNDKIKRNTYEKQGNFSCSQRVMSNQRILLGICFEMEDTIELLVITLVETRLEGNIDLHLRCWWIFGQCGIRMANITQKYKCENRGIAFTVCFNGYNGNNTAFGTIAVPPMGETFFWLIRTVWAEVL